MNYRHAQLLTPTDVGTNGTKIIEIPKGEIISAIEITFKTTKASSGMSAGAPANIPRIELLDGSTPLFSLTGYEAQALGYYNRPGRVLDHGQHISTLSEFDIYPIDFGRYLWDPMLAFSPDRFKNPTLQVQWDEDVSDTSVTVNSMEVWAHIFDELQVNPVGFLSAEEVDIWTPTAADAYHEITLPTEYSIRQLLVRAYQDGYEPWYNIDEARLDEGIGKRTMFEYTVLEDYYRRMKGTWPKIDLNIVVNSDTGGKTFYVPQTDYYSGAGAGMGLGGTTEVYYSNAAPRAGKLALTGSANINYLAQVSGYLPWHTYQFALGKQQDIEDWYDPQGKTPRLRLRASTGGSSVNGYTFVERLRRY